MTQGWLTLIVGLLVLVGGELVRILQRNANRALSMWTSCQDQLRKVVKNLNEFALMRSTRIGITNIVESLLKEAGLDDENTSSGK